MAIIKKLVLFSKEFGVKPTKLEAAGLFNPALTADTQLFIDPLLLRHSKEPLMSGSAAGRVRQRFEDLHALLAQRPRTEVIVQAIDEKLNFSEVAGTCLGYTAGGIAGRGIGKIKRAQIYRFGSQIEEAGRSNPDLLPMLSLLGSGIGPDLISDMTTNIIVEELATLTAAFAKANKLKTQKFTFEGVTYLLPENPYTETRTPILLVPTDVLRDLPQIGSWSDVMSEYSEHTQLKQQLNKFIGQIMRDKHMLAAEKREKAIALLQETSEAVALIGEYMLSVGSTKYDLATDPSTRLVFQRLLGQVEAKFPMGTALKVPTSVTDFIALVRAVIEQFKFLLEEKGVWRLLWNGEKRLREEVAQIVFYCIAYSYCAHYDVHIGVEHHTGDGRTDFIFTKGKSIVLIVELKWSDNPSLLQGYQKQVSKYITAEKAHRAFYVVLDCDEGDKFSAFKKKVTVKGKPENPRIDVVHVDANPKEAPSKIPL